MQTFLLELGEAFLLLQDRSVFLLMGSILVVKYTLPEDNNQIFASKYKLYMPSEEEFKRELEKEQELLEIERKYKMK